MFTFSCSLNSVELCSFFVLIYFLLCQELLFPPVLEVQTWVVWSTYLYRRTYMSQHFNIWVSSLTWQGFFDFLALYQSANLTYARRATNRYTINRSSTNHWEMSFVGAENRWIWTLLHMKILGKGDKPSHPTPCQECGKCSQLSKRLYWIQKKWLLEGGGRSRGKL